MSANRHGTSGRTAAIEFAVQSCSFCERACGAALAHLDGDLGPANTSSMVEALSSCRRLVQMNGDLLRQRSPLHPLMSAACVAACVLVCRACEIVGEAKARRGETDPLLKEVGDTCWIAAHACRDVVSGGPRPSRAS